MEVMRLINPIDVILCCNSMFRVFLHPHVSFDKLCNFKHALQVSCGNRRNDATSSPTTFTTIASTTIIHVLVCDILRCISNLRLSPSICCTRMVQNRRGASPGRSGRQRIFPPRQELLDICSALPASISQHQIYYNRPHAVISRHIFPARTLVCIQALRHPPPRLCRRIRQVFGLVYFSLNRRISQCSQRYSAFAAQNMAGRPEPQSTCTLLHCVAFTALTFPTGSFSQCVLLLAPASGRRREK